MSDAQSWDMQPCNLDSQKNGGVRLLEHVRLLGRIRYIYIYIYIYTHIYIHTYILINISDLVDDIITKLLKLDNDTKEFRKVKNDTDKQSLQDVIQFWKV